MIKQIRSTLNEQQWTGSVTEYSHQIWLAGLGAFATAQQEGKRGFETLIEAGTRAERSAIKAAGATIEGAVAETTKRWSELQTAIENKAKQSLARLNFARSADIDTLIERIDTLRKQIETVGR